MKDTEKIVILQRMTTIEKAIELLQPIKYQPHPVAYFVLMNDSDMGDQGHCLNCIEQAVKEAKDLIKTERNKIIDDHAKISKDGYYYHNNKKIKVTESVINKSKRFKLKDYPARAKFSYEGHDPDFGGGLKGPCSCDMCGEYFQCNFEPDIDEAKSLLSLVKDNEIISEMDKWRILTAFENYKYADDDAKKTLEKVAKKTILLYK